MSHTIVIGAGYGGSMCAARLAGRGARVTVVDPSPVFQHRVRFHELAAGVPDPDRPLGPWLGVPHVRARAVSVRPGQVTLDDGRELAADHVVVAVGRGFHGPAGTVGLTTVAAVRRLAEAVDAGTPVTVVGAGLSGVELAGALAGRARVTLLDAGDLDAFSSDVATCLRRWMRAAGVAHRPGVRFDPADPGGGTEGLVVWTGGTRGRALPVEGARVQPDGRLQAGPDLEVVPGVWGVGDAVALAHRPWAESGCALALPMGAHVADQILGRPRAPFGYRWTAKLVGFGPRAVLQGTDACGRPTRQLAAGWLVGRLKDAVIGTALTTIRLERRTGLRVFRWPAAAETLPVAA